MDEKIRKFMETQDYNALIRDKRNEVYKRYDEMVIEGNWEKANEYLSELDGPEYQYRHFE